jgi:hypothetical protein
MTFNIDAFVAEIIEEYHSSDNKNLKSIYDTHFHRKFKCNVRLYDAIYYMVEDAANS